MKRPKKPKKKPGRLLKFASEPVDGLAELKRKAAAAAVVLALAQEARTASVCPDTFLHVRKRLAGSLTRRAIEPACHFIQSKVEGKISDEDQS